MTVNMDFAPESSHFIYIKNMYLFIIEKKKKKEIRGLILHPCASCVLCRALKKYVIYNFSTPEQLMG
jgi:hypothetical protein